MNSAKKKTWPDVSGYPLDQSPFFRLNSRKKLAALYDLSLKEFEASISDTDNYRLFTIRKRTPKERAIEWPKPRLEQLHSRTLNLLQRIKQPPYLHSGVRNRSYISNAHEHLGNGKLIKLDIKKFYPSTNGAHIYGAIRLHFETSSDVAGALVALATYNNHLPTGSCISQALAFLAHKKMFDEIFSLCSENGLKMTCYVDDITVSGGAANRKMALAIGRIIQARGLDYHKVRVFGADDPKIVTGVVIRGDEVLVPNRRQQSIFERLMETRSLAPNPSLYGELEKLLGMTNAAAELEGRYTETSLEIRSRMLGVRKFIRQDVPDHET